MSVTATALPIEGRSAIRGGVIGNYVDQIHIFLPVTALAPALGTLAGPHAAISTGVFVVIATLLGRPIGAMVFGLIADRIGRTSTTRIAIAGIAACTAAIALMPTHATIGVWAIALVIVLRFLGGAFLAGEYTSAIPLAMEWSKPRQRGVVSGMIMSMAPLAQGTIALVTALWLALIGPQSYAAWGWRISFIAGAIASLILLAYYSHRVKDAPAFVRRECTGPSLGQLMAGRHAPAFWQMFGLMTGLWFMTNMVVIQLTVRLSHDAGLAPYQVSWVMVAASAAQAVFMAAAGELSTRIGRQRLFVVWGMAAALIGPILWWTLMKGGNPWWLAGLAAALHVVTVCAYGPIGAYLNEGFPTEIRATGYGTAYSLSIVIPALHPFYLPSLEAWLGRDVIPMVLIVIGGLLVAWCALLGPRLPPSELNAGLDHLAARA